MGVPKEYHYNPFTKKSSLFFSDWSLSQTNWPDTCGDAVSYGCRPSAFFVCLQVSVAVAVRSFYKLDDGADMQMRMFNVDVSEVRPRHVFPVYGHLSLIH